MSQGKIVQIIGAVVDVEFAREDVPKIYDALKVNDTDITLEVQQQLGDGVVRTIALGSTDGLRRNLVAVNTGSAISVPVGIGTLGHLAMTMLAKQAGVDIVHVPYRGGGPAMNDVLGGHVDLIVGSAALITAQLGTNRLRPILQMGRERMPALKDTQTAIEAGYPAFETLAWWGIFAPKDTPSDIIDSMAKSVKEILSDPAVATNLQDTQQMTLLLADAKDFEKFFAKQVSVWGQVVRENNIKA